MIQLSQNSTHSRTLLSGGIMQDSSWRMQAGAWFTLPAVSHTCILDKTQMQVAEVSFLRRMAGHCFRGQGEGSCHSGGAHSSDMSMNVRSYPGLPLFLHLLSKRPKGTLVLQSSLQGVENSGRARYSRKGIWI